MAQEKLDVIEEHSVGEKAFIVTKRLENGTLKIENKDNLYLQEGYLPYRLSYAKYENEKLFEAILEVFPPERIEELKKVSPFHSATFWMDLHFHRSGELFAVEFHLRTRDIVTLQELSEFEDQLKKRLVMFEFLNHQMDGYQHFNISLFLKLQRALETNSSK